MSCCPPGAEKFLAPDYTATGKCVNLSGDNACYVATPSASTGRGVLIVPDIWGWNSGRTRNIADLLAAEGYFVVVPRILQPVFNGGTDGDGFPGDYSGWADFATHIRQYPVSRE